MSTVHRTRARGFLLIALVALITLPALSQVDASGEWSPRLHEDQAERMAGPDLGDYLGLPINDAARLSADRLGRGPTDAT